MVKTTETILCAAIHYKGENSPVHTVGNVSGLVLCGYRHCHIIGQYLILRGETNKVPYEQGFLTSKNRFVDRVEGAIIAFTAGQIKVAKNKLFSEDLYEV